jgi:hypothetical protein
LAGQSRMNREELCEAVAAAMLMQPTDERSQTMSAFVYELADSGADEVEISERSRRVSAAVEPGPISVTQ